MNEEISDLIRLRRDLHQYPEYGWCEYRTTSIVATALRRAGYTIKYLSDLLNPQQLMRDVPDLTINDEEQKRRAIAEGADPQIISPLVIPGLIATIEAPTPGIRRGLRCDIDAVNVTESGEDNHLPVQMHFQSLHDRLHHACGHDGHCALAVHCALMIAGKIKDLCGSYTFIFQPAEEGCRGAYALRHLPQITRLDELYGFHLGICARDHELVVNPCDFLVSTKFNVTVYGKSAHAGIEPHRGINALECSCKIATELLALRRIRSSARFNIGKFFSDNARNVVADKVTFQCESRDETDEGNEEIFELAQKIIAAHCQELGCRWQLDIVGRACGIDNSPKLLDRLRAIGPKCNFKVIERRSFNACEDCGHLIAAVQQNGGSGAYLVIGNSIAAGHHNSAFDLSEEALPQDLQLLYQIMSQEKINHPNTAN